MGDNIGSGSVNVVQLSNWKYVIYGCLMTIDHSLSLDPNRCYYPLITNLRQEVIGLKNFRIFLFCRAITV